MIVMFESVKVASTGVHKAMLRENSRKPVSISGREATGGDMDRIHIGIITTAVC